MPVYSVGYCCLKLAINSSRIARLGWLSAGFQYLHRCKRVPTEARADVSGLERSFSGEGLVTTSILAWVT
jgi:hypothetical protein